MALSRHVLECGSRGEQAREEAVLVVGDGHKVILLQRQDWTGRNKEITVILPA